MSTQKKSLTSLLLVGVVVLMVASSGGIAKQTVVSSPQKSAAQANIQSIEPNENPTKSVSLDSNTSIDAEITENDVDWFAVDVPVGHRVVANLTKPTGQSELEIALFTLQRQIGSQQIAVDATTGFVADTATATTTYYIRVQGASDDANSPYTLRINTRPTDAFEPNEHPRSAVSLTQNVTGEITEHDHDYFTFTAKQGERVVVNLTKPAGSSGLELILFNLSAQINERQIEVDETQGYVADTADADTRYFVLIRGADGRDSSQYSLTFSRRDTDSFEPNENRIQAVTTAPRSSVTGEITEHDVDWFRFDATVGDRVVVNLTKPAGRSELEISLFTPNGEVDTQSVAVDATQGFVADTAEANTTYFIRVRGAERDVSPYQLNISTQGSDAFEPNQNRVQAITFSSAPPPNQTNTT